MKTYLFRVEFELDKEDGVWSLCIPALPGCALDADSVAEGLVFLQETAEAYVDVLLEARDEVPSDTFDTGVIEGAVIAVIAPLSREGRIWKTYGRSEAVRE